MVRPIFFAKSINTPRAPSPEGSERNTHAKKYGELLDKTHVVVTTNENADRQSSNYHDSKNTAISYRDQRHGDIELQVSGKGREESIKVFKNGREVAFSTKINRNILSMNGSFPHHEMHLLERMSSQQRQPRADVLPYMEINDNSKKHGPSTSSQQLSELIDFRLDRNKKLDEIVVPVLSNNEHWFMLSFKLDGESKTIKPTIMNTINEAKQKGNLPEILDGYKSVTALVEATINQSKELSNHSVSPATFCQSLQYGNMGCGITTSLNEQALLSGEIKVENLEFTSDSFRTSEEPLSVDVFYQGKKHHFEGEKADQVKKFKEITVGNNIPHRMVESDNYSQNDFLEDVGRFFGGDNRDLIEVEVKDSSLPLLKEDKSQRSNLALESIRRVDLAFSSSKIEKQRESLHQDLGVKLLEKNMKKTFLVPDGK